MRRRWIVAAVLVALVAPTTVPEARAAVGALKGTPAGEIPVPEPAALAPVPGGECVPENAYESAQWGATASGQFEGAGCERLRFSYGPIAVKPGQNDALILPVTIEKPAYDGYVTRFRPDLVRADGVPPAVDEIHLHHSVWLRGEEAVAFPPSAFNDDLIPFFASGEEKTTALLPHGYGYPVADTDVWLLLFMVHNYTTRTDAVWITYDIDFVPTATADAAGITEVHPTWIDVLRRPIAPGAPNTPANPVFNVQKGYGHDEGGRQVCTWPDENCARFDPYGNVTPQQGVPAAVDGAYETIDGELVGANNGTLVWIGGHLHPGGIRNDVELVRGNQSRLIFRSEGVAWNRVNPGSPTSLGKAGGPNDSWDFSMTTTQAQYGWKVNVTRGDRFRINATYDSSIAWYENMGIVVGFVAPGEQSGLDVFAPGVSVVDGVPTGAPRPSGWSPPLCAPSATTLCARGVPTHGHLPEASHFGGQGATPLPAAAGDAVTTVPVADFTFGQADQGVIFSTGQVPTVRSGQTVRFVNADTAGDIWHTITRCREPCSGGSGLDYPKADGADDSLATADDYDSSEIGYGLFFSPAKVHVDEALQRMGEPPWQFSNLTRFAAEMEEGVLWSFTPDASDVGDTVAFFCRIHIAMRGAVKVVP